MQIPSIDARPLLDQYRAMQIKPVLQAASQVALTKPYNGVSLKQPEPVLAKPVAVSASDGQNLPFKSLAGTRGTALGAPRPASAPTPTLAPQSPLAVDRCYSWVYNPSLFEGYGWYSFVPAVYIDTSAYFTPPNSLRVLQDSDGYTLGGLYDADSFGQEFVFPSSGINSLQVDFKIAMLNRTSGDHVYAVFYPVNANGTLGSFLAYAEVTQYTTTGSWYSQATYVDFSFTGGSAIINAMRGNLIALVFQTEMDGSGASFDVSFDDISMKLCTPTILPTGRISGQVSQNSAVPPADDSSLLLTYTEADGTLDIVDVTYPEVGTGNYEFTNLVSPGTNEYYNVWYLNDGTNANAVSLWATSAISSLGGSSDLTGVNFDIKDVTLVSPAHEAEAAFPVTFNWNSRLSGDSYYLCIYDMQTLEEVCSTQAINDISFTLNASDLQGITGFTFGYGRRYGWYLWAVGSGSSGIGFSYSARAVTFVASLSTPPSNPPPPSGSPPTGATQDWTVMIYIAGDNNLGDPERYTNPNNNLQGQFASLKQLAASYPNINLVTLTDFYDDSGTQLCHLKPDGTQNCQQLGEQDTSNPATLTSFIITATTNFPATHTMLVIADHGHGITGLAADETTSRTAQMTPDGLRQALQNANLSTNKVDILFYNACLLGNFEAVYDASSFANYLVASANEVWVLNIYSRLLPLLTSTAQPRDVAIGIVSAYKQAVDAIASGYFVSSAAYDLARVSPVNTALSALATAMSNDLSYSRSVIDGVRGQVQLYDSSVDSQIGAEDAFVDLRDLATRLQTSPSATTSIKTAASNLLTQLGPVGGGSSLVIASQQVTGRNGASGTDNLSNAYGLSVYFPNGQNTGQQPTLTNAYLNKNNYQTYNNATQWDDFVRVYVSGDISGGPASVQSGARPASGALPAVNALFLPLIRR
jgi:hypothetical protein